MEKDVVGSRTGQWLDVINAAFQLERVNAAQYSPLTLAYLGDGVYDLIIRTVLVERANAPVKGLNREANALVNAGFQAKLAQAILPLLNEDEAAIFNRGRNAKAAHIAKHAKPIDYRYATGFEALMGYLYLATRWERAVELVRTGLADCAEELTQLKCNLTIDGR